MRASGRRELPAPNRPQPRDPRRIECRPQRLADGRLRRRRSTRRRHHPERDAQPPIETVQGAPLASITSLTIPLGGFYERGGVTAASVIAPKECTTDLTWSVSAKLSDGKGAEATTSAAITSACPGASKSEEEAAIAKKAAEEAQAKKNAEEERSATVKIKKVKVGAGRILVTVKLTHAGRVTITGPGLKKTVASLAAGTHQIAVALTAAGKRERKHRKRIKLAVSLKMSAYKVTNSEKVKL